MAERGDAALPGWTIVAGFVVLMIAFQLFVRITRRSAVYQRSGRGGWNAGPTIWWGGGGGGGSWGGGGGGGGGFSGGGGSFGGGGAGGGW